MGNQSKVVGSNVRINECNLEKWNKIDKKSSFLSKLVNDYLQDKVAQLNLSPEIEKMYKEDHDSNYILNKLITEYYKNNIIFVDEYKRMIEFNNQFMGILNGKLSNDKLSINATEGTNYKETSIDKDEEKIDVVEEEVNKNNENIEIDNISEDKKEEVVEEEENSEEEEKTEEEKTEEEKEEVVENPTVNEKATEISKSVLRERAFRK